MPGLFVSHSSKDDAVATALEAWLNANGFSDTFIDHKSIAGGDKWGEALRASAGACRVVLCLVSPNWLSSIECFSEFRAAWYMGKRIIPLFLLPQASGLDAEAKKRFATVCAEDQGVDLMACLDAEGRLNIETDQDAATRLRMGLRAAGANQDVGLDPKAFDIDKKLRPTPFPGLASFGDDDADAALFYGHSREIAETLEELRKIRVEGEQKAFVILGASGAGKSSLLRAGIIPRLRRESPAFLPLRAFRPGADPLLNFAKALSRTLADYGRPEVEGAIRDRLLDAWFKAERDEKGELTPAALFALDKAIENEGKALREAADGTGASIIVSVDQAEEMARAEGASADALADYLRVALAISRSPWHIAFTIRSDSFPELQNHRRFQKVETHLYDLRAVPTFRFDDVIEEPAKRYDVKVDHLLVEALMKDAPKEDALPLLAFALQRLWHQYAASGLLSKAQYDKVGGLDRLLGGAAERAMRGIEQDAPLPSTPPPKGLADLTESTFVPTLVQVNDKGVTIRRTAHWSEFKKEQQDLLERFVRWRLVVRKGETDGGTIEVAHDALFRAWKQLESWLGPERVRLDALRSLQAASANWERNGRNEGYLDHRSARLAEARALGTDARYAKRLFPRDFDYLAACTADESAASARARRRKVLVGGLVILLAWSSVGWVYREPIQQFALEQYQWLWVMGPSMLTAGEEKAKARAAEEVKAKGQARGKDLEFSECKRGCPRMVMVPAGTFKMGSPESEPGRYREEGPQHDVAIATPFAVSVHEVTFDEWDACVAGGGCNKYRPGDKDWGRGKRPVINVSWNDAKQYVSWLSRLTGKEYRLLTEAEWEYAARADTQAAYSWGGEIGKGNANCDGCGSQWDKKQTAPVGSFEPNAFSLHDMHGNVWEWVEDSWHGNYKGEPPQDGSAWLEGGNKAYRVVRGGSWRHPPQLLRAAMRFEYQPDVQIEFIGFRVARTLSP